jgi:hypothetical protein
VSHNSYYKTILSYFQSMDIEKLRLYLKDEYTYQDTTKEIFLEKVQEVFESYRIAGDTELVFYPGKCGVENNLCDNCGKSGYRFVGNNSGDYIDFIFEIEGNDIKDIYDCSRFKTDVDVKNLNEQRDIYIKLEDKVTFVKSPEYWVKVNAALLAYSEIITIPARMLDFDELCYWVEKHSITNQKIGDYDIFKPSMKWSPFSSLYAELKEIKNYILKHLNNFEIAKRKLKNAITEEQIIEWVLKFEPLHEEAPFDLKYQLEKKEDCYIFQKRNPIYFHGVELTLAIYFLKTYQENETELLSKYNTYTQEEEVDAFNNDDAFNTKTDITSLKFHLQKRKALAEIGIEIPYYINKNLGK